MFERTVLERRGGGLQGATYVPLAYVEEDVGGNRCRPSLNRVSANPLLGEAEDFLVDVVEGGTEAKPAAQASQPGPQHLQQDAGCDLVGGGSTGERGERVVCVGLGSGPHTDDEIIEIFSEECRLG